AWRGGIMPFSKFACWDRDTLADTIVIDAATPFDSVFLATHHPSRILKRETGALAGVGQPYTEQEVLQDLLRSDADPLLLPIVGESGSGKSHLIRWLRAAMDTGDPSRHFVYIPKYNTSLRGVIEAIIEGFEGPEFESVSQALR